MDCSADQRTMKKRCELLIVMPAAALTPSDEGETATSAFEGVHRDEMRSSSWLVEMKMRRDEMRWQVGSWVMVSFFPRWGDGERA